MGTDRGAATRASQSEVRVFVFMAVSRFSVLVVLLFLAGLLCPPSGRAQSPPADSALGDSSDVAWKTSLSPLTITASRLSSDPSRAPTRITVLDSAALHGLGTSSLASVLDDDASLHVRRYGHGGLAAPSLRGSGASHTALLLDGQRITDPQLGLFDLSLFPTVLLHSVEIMHGSASPLYGSDGLAGAIHLRTLRSPTSGRLRAHLQAGAYGEREVSLLAGGPLAKTTTALGAAEYRRTQNNFPYVDSTLYPPKTVRHRNADRTRGTVFGQFQSAVGDHSLRLAAWGTRAERGLPPRSSTGAAQERQADTQLRLWARDHVPTDSGTLTLQALNQYTKLHYRDPRADLDETGRTWTASVETIRRAPITTRWTMAGGLSTGYAHARHPRLETNAHQYHLAAFTEGHGRYGRLRLFPAVRAETYWVPDGTNRTPVTSRLGANIQPVSSWPDVYLKAHVGRAFRMPTFNDRYWQPGGNPNLQPERSWDADVGLRFDPAAGHTEITVFGHWRRNQIVWEPTDEGVPTPRNVKHVRVHGAQASVAHTTALFSGVDLQTKINYTLTDARNRADPESASYDQPLRLVPRNQVTSTVGVTWTSLTLMTRARHTGRRFVTNDGSQSLRPHRVVNVQFQIDEEIGGIRTTLSLQIENVFDTDYRSIGRRPMPPRHGRVRILLDL